MENARGVTLLELLVVVLLLSILTGISLPGFQHLIEQKKADIAIGRLGHAIELARTFAITTGHLVTLCRSANGEDCGGQWRDGTIIFTDRNGDRRINQDDKLLHYVRFPDINGSIHWRAFQNRQYLQITNMGFTRYQNGNFTYCPNNKKSELARQLIINRTARIRYASDSDGDGIREDSSGRPIRCD